MDILLSSFVNRYINDLTNTLNELEKFLNFEDEIINYFITKLRTTN